MGASGATMAVAPMEGSAIVSSCARNGKMREFQDKCIYTQAPSPVPAPSLASSSSQESEV